MAVIHFSGTAHVTPQQFVAALTDFGPGRSAVFANSADDKLVVHSRTETSADVTEGKGGVWERLAYDWSDPTVVTMSVVDSNVFSASSGHTYRLVPQVDGTTLVDVTVVREGKNLKGRIVSALLGSVGKKALTSAFAGSLAAIDARHDGTTTRAVA